MKTEIVIKFLDIILDLLIECFGAIPINLGQVGIEHHLDTANGVYPRFEQGFVDEWELCNGQFISFSCHNNPLDYSGAAEPPVRRSEGH